MKLFRTALKLWLFGFVISAMFAGLALYGVYYTTTDEYKEEDCVKRYQLLSAERNTKESCLHQYAREQREAQASSLARGYLARSQKPWKFSNVLSMPGHLDLIVEGIPLMRVDNIKKVFERLSAAEKDPSNEWHDYAVNPRISAAIKAAYEREQERIRTRAEMKKHDEELQKALDARHLKK